MSERVRRNAIVDTVQTALEEFSDLDLHCFYIPVCLKTLDRLDVYMVRPVSGRSQGHGWHRGKTLTCHCCSLGSFPGAGIWQGSGRVSEVHGFLPFSEDHVTAFGTCL